MKSNDKKLKNKGISQKQQGESARSRGASDSAEKPFPRQLNRGIGSSYAMAVENLLGEAKHQKGSSKDSFLGKKKETLDPKKYAHSVTKKK